MSAAPPSSSRPLRAGAVAHGGVGSDPRFSDGCRAAVDVALQVLAATDDPVQAAVAGTVVLEDDPRFNAGTGSVVRLDGSVQMDASVMSSDGRFGAVAGVERVKNPVLVAAAVRETPHLLLAGDGATRFARVLGHADYDPSTAERRAASDRLKRRLAAADPGLGAFWQNGDWRRFWNYAAAPDELGIPIDERGSDTVGVVVRTRDGRFAAALSTGGTAAMLRGRVGDVPLYGAGLFATAHGAAAATGVGERITEVLMAHTTCTWLAAGTPAQEAATRGIALVKSAAERGLIVITPTEIAADSSHPMAWAGRSEGESW